MTPPNPPTLAQVLEVAREVVRLDGEAENCTHHDSSREFTAHARTAAPLLAAFAIAIGPALEEWREARAVWSAAFADRPGYVRTVDRYNRACDALAALAGTVTP